ncbi:MAG: hypothetical protein WDW38_001779 [Sanguina aurantia]
MVPISVQRRILTASSLGLGVYAAATVRSVDDARLLWLIPTRLARDVWTAAATVADYQLSLPPSLKGAEREEALHGCHSRGAQRLLSLAFSNGGVYVKIGQHIAQLDHLLPMEYVSTMRDHLLDKCPASSYADVQRMIFEDFGKTPEQLFAYFNPVPIASASLAQVHVAVDHSGRQLAVKVQHSGLRESSHADIQTVVILVKMVKWLYPDFNYEWLADEVKDNLPKELNFIHEAGNAERCRRNLTSPRSHIKQGRVHIPKIYHELVSSRILTMEFMDGSSVTDLQGLQQRGINPQELAKLVSETFNEMIFTFGDVHCDPHAANLLARTDKNGQLQLVLLDHGLYRQISDEFRHEYAGLWRALVFGDAAGIQQHAQAMNAGELYKLFSAILTQKSWDEVTDQRADHLAVQATDENREFAQSYAAAHTREISDLLVRIPRPLLLLFKTNDCLRAVDKCLGANVNTFVITARACSRSLSEQRQIERPGLRSRFRGVADSFMMEFRIMLLQLAVSLASKRQLVPGVNGGSQYAV